MSRIKKIDYIITDSEIEAFLLESNLIKKYRPLFNIELKDQQRYTYLKITDEKFPRLLVTRRNRNGEFMGPKGEIFGPFVKGSSRSRVLLKPKNTIFPLYVLGLTSAISIINLIFLTFFGFIKNGSVASSLSGR